MNRIIEIIRNLYKYFVSTHKMENPSRAIQSISKFIFTKGSLCLSILWMNPNLRWGVCVGSDTPTLNTLKVFVGLSRGGHMIALHDCFLRDLHLWSSALKPTCYCYFTGHYKDKGPTDRDTHTNCNGIWLGNSLMSMLNVIFELHDLPSWAELINTELTGSVNIGQAPALWKGGFTLFFYNIQQKYFWTMFSSYKRFWNGENILLSLQSNASNVCLRKQSLFGGN